MKVMTWPPAERIFLQHRLEPLLELTSVLRAGHHRSEVEADQTLALQGLRHVVVRDPLREALDHCGLAHARVTDQDGVVLGTTRQHLHDATDLGVAPDDRVEPAFSGRFGQVQAVLGQGVIRRLRILGSDLGAATQPGDLPGDGLRVEAEVAGPGEREQDVVGRHIAVAHRGHDLLCLVEHGQARSGQTRGADRGATHLGRVGQSAGRRLSCGCSR